jgi:hypothetical protein
MLKEHVGDANIKQVSLKSYNKSRCAELAYSLDTETNQMMRPLDAFTEVFLGV